MSQQDRLFSLLSLGMLGLTLLTIVYYIVITVNPMTGLNPFPPDPAGFIVATSTPTPIPTETPVATWTPTRTPTITPTPPPSFTPTITPTPEPTVPPTDTPTPSLTPSPTPRVTRSPYPFTYELSYETPYYGCAWMGVAGNVQDIDGNPLEGYPIHIWGGGIDVVVTSGDKQMYGDSGWEQFFNNAPMDAAGIFRVQIHARDNPDHPPVSEEIVLNFEGFCSKSLALINFVKNH